MTSLLSSGGSSVTSSAAAAGTRLCWRWSASVQAWAVLFLVVELIVAAAWAEPQQRGDMPLLFRGDTCNCNGRSDECYFDQELYDKTGHGGHCFNCRGNTAGPHCERCSENYYMRRGDDYCIECRCNPTGSRDLQCNSEGTCQCKPGVGGEKCDQCLPNFYGFSETGCQPCGCVVSGSLDNEPRCDPASGECLCKENVEGTRCDKCKPGFFNLRLENRFGCSACFCYGHSSICQAAPSYARGSISSIFSRSEEGWTAEDIYRRPVSVSFNTATRSIRLEAQGDETVYFLAPRQFLGDQRASYNQPLKFRLRIGEVGLKASPEDLIIEGGGMSISRPILNAGNTLPSIQTQEFTFTLHEHPDYRWSPRMSARSFMTILSNITAIKIRGTYNPRGVGFLENVELDTARRGLSGAAADWVEICTCPEGYVGQFCESCAPGFHHSPALGGPFAKCDPCNCHGHADVCDAESGKCICADNTAGDNCERCARGYYGNAVAGKKDDCKKCPCPNDGPCVQIIDGSVICTDCAEGYSGTRCDLCSDGYFGDPTGQFGPKTPCRKCDCNSNIDPNAVGNCRRTTGECLKCIYNTAGPRCDECRPGYYGDPLSFPKGDCKQCGCFPLGTMETITHGGDNYQDKSMITYNCDQLTGQCTCKPYVIGQKCDRCAEGFFNIRSGAGCEACQCNAIGSLNNTCQPETGQCFCKPGVVGLKCDQCAENFYGFSYDGCNTCDCDPLGSNNMQCDTDGSCPCREGVTGRRCDRCAENRYDKKAGCKDCPPCYTLVQMAVDEHRNKLSQIQKLLDEISNNRTLIEDVNFENELRRVQGEVDNLLEESKRSAMAVAGGEISLAEQLKELQKRMETMAAMLSVIYDTVRDASEKADSGDRAAYQTEGIIQQAKEILINAEKFLDQEGGDALKRAKDRSEQFGQQSERMSTVSRQARLLADDHEAQAADIEKMANEAFNTSTEAFNLAERATTQLLETQQKLEQLDKDSTKLTELLRETQEHSTRSQTESRAAREKAMTIVSDARILSVPDIDTGNLDAEAARIKEEAEGIIKDADELVSDKEGLLKEAHSKIKEAEELLKRGIQQQQTADSLLSEVDAAKSEADSAVQRGDAILIEAEKTLKTLKDFDGQVQESKDQAENAIQMIGEIEKMIQEAEQQTVQARRALLGAEKEADEAKSVAEQAENLSKSASQDAAKIEDETKATKQKAGELKAKADNLEVEVRRLDERLGVYQNQAAEDKNISRMALEKAEQAKANAKTASQKVSDGLNKVEEIRRDLSRLDRIDVKELERLENRYKQVEFELQQSGLEETLKDFRIAINLQRKWMADYDSEIRFLEEEVTNIKAISQALPDGCFKRVTLEP